MLPPGDIIWQPIYPDQWVSLQHHPSKANCDQTKGSDAWVHIFSHVRPFYERAVSDLDS